VAKRNWGEKPDKETRRENRQKIFEMILEVREELMEPEFVFDEERQLFLTRDGRTVLSRYFIDTDLLFGGEGQVSPGLRSRTFLSGLSI
jgi:hypothetical protein